MDTPSKLFLYSLFLLQLHLHLHLLQAQQTYLNNDQLDCYNNINSTKGYICNGLQPSCQAYLTFRSLPPYNSPVTIGDLLNVEPALISALNNISTFSPIPTNTQIILPINCSCSANATYYQHLSSYRLLREDQDYCNVANITFQGLTTCRAMMDSNPYDGYNLYAGLDLKVPLLCACPTRNQTARGAKFLVTYLPDWDQSITSIAPMFGVDEQSIYDANRLTEDLIYPFTALLVPLKTEASRLQQPVASPAPAKSPPSTIDPVVGSHSSRKWVFVGVGVGAALLLLVALFGFLCCFFRSNKKNKNKKCSEEGGKEQFSVRSAIESLTPYRFEDLERATNCFSEGNKISGPVYRGSLQGGTAAIKILAGDVSGEVNLLKQINHISVITLMGFCIHGGNTYLVYEYSENGSLSARLHYNTSTTLPWRQRAQIAYDVADGLNYLHNYTNPPYIHKNLKTSNILLDSNFRAKIANFGLARTVGGGFELTRHVVGTQGYMAPEYIEHGAISSKIDVYAFGVVLLELLSGREAVGGGEKSGEVLSGSIAELLEGENMREKLKGFVDPCLGSEYPLDLAFSMAELARDCVGDDPNSRPDMAKVVMVLTQVLSSAMEWDPSYELEHSIELPR